MNTSPSSLLSATELMKFRGAELLRTYATFGSGGNALGLFLAVRAGNLPWAIAEAIALTACACTIEYAKATQARTYALIKQRGTDT